MLLEGSCHCGAVRFQVESSTPYPYQACYCSICRKTAGGGGYAINLGADANTLEIEGKENLSVYNAKLYDRGESGGHRPARRSATSAGSAGASSGFTTCGGPTLSIPSPRR
jgi:hypothetical protein